MGSAALRIVIGLALIALVVALLITLSTAWVAQRSGLAPETVASLRWFLLWGGLATMLVAIGVKMSLANADRRYRDTLDSIGIGLMQVDQSGRIAFANRQLCRMLGYAADELSAKHLHDITHPDDRAGSAVGQDGSEKIRANQEQRYLRKDGGEIWVRRSDAVVRDKKGTPLFGLCSVEDVSNQRASQETLTALNESLRAIVETSPLAIYSITPSGMVTLWNPAAEVMFGLLQAEVIGKPSPLLQGESAGFARAMRDLVLTGDTVHDIDVTWRTEGMAPKELSLSAAPLRGTARQIIGVIITCVDVTTLKSTAKALDQQLHFTEELLEAIPNPIFYRGIDGRYLGFNRAWEQAFAIRRDDWIGKSPADLYPPDEVEKYLAQDKEVLDSGVPRALDEVMVDGSGSPRNMVKQLSRFTSADGSPAGLVGVLTDVTNFRNVERALQVSEGRFKVLTESAMDLVSVLSENGIVLYQSPSIKRVLGYDPDEVLGKDLFSLAHRDDTAMLKTLMHDLVQGAAVERTAQFRVRSKGGDWRMLESIAKNCIDIPEIGGIIVNTRDITERRAFEEKIRHLAYHDALTDLPNRALMQDRVANAVTRADRSGHKFAVMFIDIDNFKNINDTLGHDVGDELLRSLAHRLLSSVRANDSIGRQGGDEFIVLLDELKTQEGASRVAHKILAALRAPFFIGGANQHVSGSIGIAIFPDDGRDAPTLLKNADTAMFHSKAFGKNTYQFFTAQMTAAIKRRAALESSLRAAVEAGNFSLVYQPQVDLHSGKVVGVEALVRWHTEDAGTVMPSEFIPLAEETGLINALGNWVLREACRQAQAWVVAGLMPRRIAVNVSARQLTDSRFLDLLRQALDDTGLAPQYLEIELTEGQVMRQGDGSIKLLKAIGDMGVHISVDDFGTGYSSLSYLKRLPISTLKIDQSFVRDIAVDSNDSAIVEAIISMAKSLQLDLIAEGIETPGQLNLLRTKGCHLGQGYYFSVPLSGAEIEPLLRKATLFNAQGGLT